MNKQISFLLMALITIIVSSCSVDDTVDPPIEATLYDNLFQFHRSVGVPAQTFTEDPSQAFSITGDQGTVVEFPANAFGDIGSGEVTIELKEVFSKKEMVKSNITCNTSEHVLETGGMVYIQALQNDEVLPMELDYEVIMPVSSDISQTGNLNLYTDNDVANGFINLILDESEQPVFDSGSNTISYQSKVGGWKSCASVYDTPTSIKVVARPELNSELAHVNAFLVFDEINTVLNMEEGDGDKFSKNLLPSGVHATIIVIAIDEYSTFQLGIEDIILDGDVEAFPLMKVFSEDEVISQLDDLL